MSSKLAIPLHLSVLVATAIPCAAQSPGFWEKRPPMRAARQELACAVLNGKVYAAGGLGANRAATKSVERFDPTTGKWTAVAALPTTLHHFGMAAVGGKLYAIGGYVSSFTGTNKCWRYDPATDKWSAIANLPRARGSVVAVGIGGKIYAIGGVVPRVGVVGDLTVYDPATNKWATLSAMTFPREHLAAAALGGRLYAAGGRRGGNVAVLEAYDPTTNKWTRRRDMPTRRGGNGAATLHGRLIVVGGEIPGIHPQAEAYDPATNTWRTLERMRPGVHGIYPVAIGQEILVAGGATVAGYGAVKSVQSLRMDPDGVTSYGIGTAACRGPLAVFVSHRPIAGESRFALLSTDLPPSTIGFLAIGLQPDFGGSTALGFRTHLNLANPIFLYSARSDAAGKSRRSAPIPAGTTGVQTYLQFVWANTSGCGGAGTVSSSHGVGVRIR
jgi:N-acetylneuraminic acid mutarotase